MKSSILILAFFLPRIIFGQSGIYHPFPESNAIWNINYSLNCNWAGIANENYSILMANDTLINSTTYHTLKTYYVESLSTGTCGTVGGDVYIYRGAIRQDTALRKVFIVPPDSLQEQLLYDFNLQVGDTVRGYLEQYPQNADVVISIDSLLLGTQYHRRWYIHQGYGIYIIEGIGCTFGLTKPSPQNLIDGPGYNLTCYSENSIPVYPTPNFQCNLINAIHNNLITEQSFTVFPNPSEGLIRLQSNSNDILKINIVNLFGQLLMIKFLSPHEAIELDNSVSGAYFIIAYDNKENIVNIQKVIIYKH